MADLRPSICLYNLTLQQPGAITHAISGSFSEKGAHEVVVARGGRILELLRITDIGKSISLASTDVFGVIRSLHAYRITGTKKDYIVIGSDAGRIAILEYQAAKGRFVRVHTETYGKTGCRRLVPGQYLAADPRGRAVMIGAVEKQKFVYVLSRDGANRLTISSPLEANKSHHLCYTIVGLDNGYENPLFASIECDYSDADSPSTPSDATLNAKSLVYYELDLGLNHVVRKWSDSIDDTANMLIPVPGGDDGPGGVLFCSQYIIAYKHIGHPEKRRVIPRRLEMLVSGQSDRGVMMISYSVLKQKDAPTLFFIQSEFGDLYKVTLEMNGDQVDDINITYFDTFPSPCSSFSVLRSGFLFAASEFGPHRVYQFQSVGEDAELQAEIFAAQTTLQDDNGEENTVELPVFRPRPLKHLTVTDELDSLSPITDLKIAEETPEESASIFALSGRGPASSSLRILKHGLPVLELANPELPSSPIAIWTLKKTIRDEFDSYIIVSFQNVTLVLSIGETVEEVHESGFYDKAPTLAASLIGDDSLIQVHPGGIRFVRADRRVSEWKAPGKKQVLKAAANGRQVLISLTGGELIYFELSPTGAMLDEVTKIDIGEATCIDLAPIPAGRLRARFAAIGLEDGSVRMLQLENMYGERTVQVVSRVQLQAPAESVVLSHIGDAGIALVSAVGGASSTPVEDESVLYLYVGLTNGVLERSTISLADGKPSDTRKRLLGNRPVKLVRNKLRSVSSVLALTSRSWLAYGYQGKYNLTPLSTEAFEHAASFCSEQCREGIIAVVGKTLRILSVEKLGQTFHTQSIPLKCTPRRMALLPPIPLPDAPASASASADDGASSSAAASALVVPGLMVIIESDQNVFTVQERERIRAEEMEFARGIRAAAREANMAEEDDGQDVSSLPSEAEIGTPVAGSGNWASYVRLLSTNSRETLDLMELSENEAAVSLAVVEFADHPGEQYVIVGTAKDLQLMPQRKHTGGFLHVYRVDVQAADESTSPAAAPVCRLNLLHRTAVDDVPQALCAFQGRLLAGIGSVLRIYDLGKKKLLRKCENRSFPNRIVWLGVAPPSSASSTGYSDRIFVGDVTESVLMVRYNRSDNSLGMIADDTAPRWVTCATPLDRDTVAIADKFGNLTVTRLSASSADGLEDFSSAQDDEDEDSGMIFDRNMSHSAGRKMEHMAEFYTNDVITCMTKSRLGGGADVLVYGTVMGAIGAVLPLSDYGDVEFFEKLQFSLREENPPLSGRDHLAYRSFYNPMKFVIDGDLCDTFTSLEAERQKSVSVDLDNRKPNEVQKKIEFIRNKIL